MKLKNLIITFILFFSSPVFAEGALHYYNLATEYFAERDYENAIRYYTYAINATWFTEPKSYILNDKLLEMPGVRNTMQSTYLGFRARAYELNRDYSNAISDYLQLGNEYSNYSVASIYDKWGKTNQAKTYFLKAFEENPCRDPDKKFKKYNLKVGFFECMFKD